MSRQWAVSTVKRTAVGCAPEDLVNLEEIVELVDALLEARAPELAALVANLKAEELASAFVVLPRPDHRLRDDPHLSVSPSHVARCVCRRAERWCVNLQEEDLFVEPIVIKYLNRLSDYLFVLSLLDLQQYREDEHQS